MKMALEGIRVVECGLFMQGPVAARILGSLGAEVIKVEHPTLGDPSRGVKESHGHSLEMPGGRNAFYENHNRNKKSVGIDLKQPKGQEIVHRLVKKSDILLQNWRPGVAQRLGIDYETLRQHNPRIICGFGSAYGPKGPLGQKAAVDTIAQAKSGIQFATGDPGSPPVMAIDSIADDMAAFALAFGLVVALYARDRLGIGQSVDCSLYGSMIRLQRWALDNYFLTGDYSGRADRGREVNPLFNRYRCKDDRWIAIAERDPQTTWPVFCTALGLQELGKECRFEGPVEKRREEGARIISILDEVFATKTYEEWEKQLNTAGDFIFSPINKAIDVGSDPQALENRYVDIFDDPNLGQVKTVGLPFLLSETPWADTSRAPELGQHTEEVLMDICDYSWEDIGKLKMQGAII